MSSRPECSTLHVEALLNDVLSCLEDTSYQILQNVAARGLAQLRLVICWLRRRPHDCTGHVSLVSVMVRVPTLQSCEGCVTAAAADLLFGSLQAGNMAVSEAYDIDSTCELLSRDALAGVMALAHPHDAISFAQSCKDLHLMHQALKARLNLGDLQRLSSCHVLGVAPDTAYVQLAIPEELITLAERQLTATEVSSLVLAFRPKPSQVHSFVHRLFRDDPSCTLRLRLLVPGSPTMIARRNELACILRALVSAVTYDLKAAISAHAQAAQLSTSMQVFYDLEVVIQTSSKHSLRIMYAQTEKKYGQAVVQQLLEKYEATCSVTGRHIEFIRWKETGLPAVFGRLPSLRQYDPTLGVSDVDCAESGSAQLWLFTPSASQIVPADSLEQVTDWL